MPVRIISLDFDGCLFHSHYFKIFEHHVLRANRLFLNHLKDENKIFSDVFLYMGSARQSKYLDGRGVKEVGTESCFDAIQKIAHYMDVPFIPLLMPDIIGDLPAGTSFERMSNPDYEGKHGLGFPDDGKLALLYAQIHHAASVYSDETIVFDFYDDRDRDILHDLSIFFEKYPQMIPRHVTLNLKHYEGGAVRHLSERSGTGEIDIDYRQTVIDMMEASLVHEPLSLQKDCIDYMTPELLACYRDKRLADAEQVSEGIATIKTDKLKQYLTHLQRISDIFLEEEKRSGFLYATRYKALTFSGSETKVPFLASTADKAQETITMEDYLRMLGPS